MAKLSDASEPTGKLGPLLAITVDTEEEFDWGRPLARSNQSVLNVAYQERAQRIFDSYGLRPTYLIDYPVVSKPEGFRPLIELVASGSCDIGAHLHPWVNPPHTESVGPKNSYAGNLPRWLEIAKLRILTDAIEQRFQKKPVVYRAGRYGLGRSTPAILGELGYAVDTSVLPHTSFARDGGPDFTRFSSSPAWLDHRKSILEVPVTVGFAGALGDFGGRLLYPGADSRFGRTFHAPGIMARTGLLDRIRLTPEGTTMAELIKVTRALYRRGQRVFVMTYHSPSLCPGNTPYVQTHRDLNLFLGRIRGFLDYFFGVLGGRPLRLHELRGQYRPDLDALSVYGCLSRPR